MVVLKLKFEISLGTLSTLYRQDGHIFLRSPFLQHPSQVVSMLSFYLLRKMPYFLLGAISESHILSNMSNKVQIPCLRLRRMSDRMYRLFFSHISSIFERFKGLRGNDRDWQLLCCVDLPLFSTINVLLSI